MTEYRSLDIPFYPYDDISYHNKEENKTGIRCVVVVPNYKVRTDYVQRSFPDIVNKINRNADCKMNQIFSQDIQYKSNGEEKELCVIYIHTMDREECCIRYNDTPLIFGDGCIITGEGFTDLTMEQCYGLVTTAKAAKRRSNTGVSVNITDDFDLVPRMIFDE